MLKINKNELAHSIIFRTHIVYGISDFSNIIRSNGQLEPLPKILSDTLHLYKPINDLDFLNLLRDIGFAKKTMRMFENPFNYIGTLKYFFGQYRNAISSIKGRKYIGYCLECIKYNIYEFGYGILKSEWGISNYCIKHETWLYAFPAINRKNTVESLKIILMGAHPENFKQLISNYKIHLNSLLGKDDQCDYILPCLEREFKSFISSSFKKFPMQLLGKNYIESHLHKKHMMETIYERSKEINYEPFNLFWKINAIRKTIQGGVIKKESILVDVFKKNDSNCQKCEHYNCFANLAIIEPTPRRNLLDSCVNSIHNIRMNAWALGETPTIDFNYINKLPIERKKELNALGLYWKTKIKKGKVIK